MTPVVAFVLAVAAFAFVAYPLFRRKRYVAPRPEDERLHELRSRQETTYSMLKELEFDRQAGVLTDDDYRQLEERYKQKAVSILKDMDGVASGKRERKPVAQGKDDIEERVLAMRKGKGRFCAECGAGIVEGDRFCSGCGASVK